MLDIRDSLPKHATKSWSKRTGKIIYFCIHHSATLATVSAESMAQYHISRGYPGIAYHYVIGPDGTISWCNDDDNFTWHGHDFNSGLGVCLVGDFVKNEPTRAQLEAARRLYYVKQKEHGPLSLVGHKEAPRAKTQCPGINWDTWKKEIIKEPMVMVNRSVLCPFYQTNPEPGAPSVDVIKNSKIGAIRALHIEDMDFNPMPDKEIHARLYTIGDEAEMASMLRGREGADEYFALCRPKYDKLKALGIFHVSGGNEPHPQNIEELKAANAWQVRMAELVGNYGMHYWAWDWSVGRPDYGLAEYWVESIKVTIQTGGGMSQHLYGAPDVIGNKHYPDKYYSLRVIDTIRELYDAGLTPQDRWVIIGEYGIDGGIIEWGKPPFDQSVRRRGWRDWSDWVYVTDNGNRIMDEAFYWERLSAGDDALASLAEVRWAFGFIAHPRPDWADFTLTQYILDHMAAKHNAVVQLPPIDDNDTGKLIAEIGQDHVLALNPGAALYKAAKAKDQSLTVASDEFYPLDGIVAQIFRTPDNDNVQYVAWCRIPEWDNVKWVERTN